jgi:hypothetical protein
MDWAVKIMESEQIYSFIQNSFLVVLFIGWVCWRIAKPYLLLKDAKAGISDIGTSFFLIDSIIYAILIFFINPLRYSDLKENLFFTVIILLFLWSLYHAILIWKLKKTNGKKQRKI